MNDHKTSAPSRHLESGVDPGNEVGMKKQRHKLILLMFNLKFLTMRLESKRVCREFFEVKYIESVSDLTSIYFSYC